MLLYYHYILRQLVKIILDQIILENMVILLYGVDYTMLEKSNVSLNVLEEDEKERFKYIYKSSEFNRKNKIDLILLEIKHVYLKNKFAISISGIFSDSNSDSESKSNQIKSKSNQF